MPRKCIFGCPFKGVAIHRFPSVNKHPDSFKAWVTAVKGTTEVTDTDYEYYKDMVVCDVHFTDHYRNRNNRINRLAVPSRVPYGIEVQTSLDLQPEHAAIKPKTESVRRQSCDQGIPCLTFDAKSNINTEQNIVTVAKTFSWQKCSEAFPIQTDDSDYSDDNVSMYCDDNEPHKTSQATGDKGNTTVHQGFRCNVCDGAITEVRYTCVQCSGFDLCCACENNRAHQQHYVLRVPALRPVAEIQFVLDTIRRHLIKRLDPIIEPEWNHGDAISIKSEVKSESEDDYDDDNDEQKVISGYESDSSDLWAARKQSDNEETHCGMDEIMKTKVSVAHAMEGVVSIEDILAETNTTDERAIAIDAREAQEMDSESPAEERVRAVRTDEMPTESDNTTNEKEIHMRGDTRETESPTVKQNTPCTDAGHHSHKPPNNKKIVIRRANIINLQEAKKICIRPFLNSQSLVNVLSLYSQSTGVVKLRKQIMVLKPVREVLTLRHQNVFASTNNNTIVGNS